MTWTVTYPGNKDSDNLSKTGILQPSWSCFDKRIWVNDDGRQLTLTRDGYTRDHRGYNMAQYLCVLVEGYFVSEKRDTNWQKLVKEMKLVDSSGRT